MSRQPNIPDYLQEPYFPEHDRLNKSPIIPANVPKPIGVPKRGLPISQPNVRPTGGAPRQQPPKQPHVNVGVHEDTMWYGDLSAGTPASKIIDNNEYVNTEAIQGHNPLAEAEKFESEEGAPAPAQAQAKGLIDLNPEEYAVIYNGKLLEATDNLEIIMSCIEDLLLQYDANIDDIFVIKRMKINYGIRLE